MVYWKVCQPLSPLAPGVLRFEPAWVLSVMVYENGRLEFDEVTAPPWMELSEVTVGLE